MGLDGFVRCRCWQDGRIEPPADLAGLIILDDDGYLSLSVPNEGNDEKYLALDRWESEACPHEDMEFANERVGNWSSYRGLQHALAEQGWHRFPALHALLPEANGGTAAASLCRTALSELDDFVRHADLGEQALLCDAETGAVILEQIHAFGGANTMVSGYAMGVALDGFFVQRGDTELFRATEFTQEILEPTNGERWPMVRFTAGTHTVSVPVGAIGGPEPPTHLRVTSRRRTMDHYTWTVDALRRLFEAAVETGNPVVWC